jgi:hypothetical protein
VSVVFSTNIIGTVLTNVHIGMPQPFCILFIVTCVVHFFLLLFLGPSSTCKPYSEFVPSFVPILVSSSSDDDNEDENPPLFVHLPPYDSIKHEPAPTLSLPR